MNDYLDRIELRQLETFRAIAEAGSFHRATSSTGYSQSVISQNLAALERIVGLRLIERGRGRRSVELTQAGETLMKHVKSIDASLGAAAADLAQLKGGAKGTIRIGTYQSVSARILPKLLSQFSLEHPDVTLEVRESADDGDLMPLLETGELDFAFTAFPLAHGPFEAIEVLRDPWLLLTDLDSPLINRAAPLPVKALRNQRLIGFSATGVIQVQLENYLRANGIEPNIIFRTNDNVAVTELVATGYGSALMPALTVSSIDTRIAQIPVAIPARSIALAWHAKRTLLPAAETIIETVQQICADIRSTI